MRLKQWFIRYKKNYIYALILTLILIGIDFFTNLFYPNFYIKSAKFTLQQIGITFAVSLLIAFLTRKSRNIFSALFILMSMVEVIYFAFFRSTIQPYHFELLFSEMADIIDSLYSIIPTLLIVGVSYAALFYLIITLSKKLQLKSSIYANYGFITLLVGLPVYAYFRPHTLTISPLNFSYLNMLYSSSLATKNLIMPMEEGEFKPYVIEKKKSQEQNVIIVMGESLSYKRMHLYGYDNNNTPNLDQLKSDSHFAFTKAVSCGVNTPVAISTFFSLKREPTNMALMLNEKTNLLKLAKDNGYHTAWFSMQEEGMSIASILKYAEAIRIRKDFAENSFDDALIDQLKTVDWNQKNFIILHLRANHSPYEKYIPKRFKSKVYDQTDYRNYKIDTYNDSVRYVDYLLKEFFSYMDSTNQSFKVYFTSDHGERLGYQDDHEKYGHSELDMEVSKVPFLLYSDQKAEIKQPILTHYQIGKMIVNDLGYTVLNPNEDGEHCFINGVNKTGSSGVIKFKIKEFPL